MGFWRIVLTIILPPLGVLLGKGFGWAFILNIILTILGYIPVAYSRVLGSNQKHLIRNVLQFDSPAYPRTLNGIRKFAGAISCLNN